MYYFNDIVVEIHVFFIIRSMLLRNLRLKIQKKLETYKKYSQAEIEESVEKKFDKPNNL